jgi:hypothetical protein
MALAMRFVPGYLFFDTSDAQIGQSTCVAGTNLALIFP